MTHRHRLVTTTGRDLRRPVQDVWDQMSDVPRLAALIPAVRRCTPLGDHWRWELATYGALGRKVTPGFDLDATFVPVESVAFRSVGNVTEGASGNGRIQLATVTGLTRVRVEFDLRVELELPRIVAVPIARIIDHEVRGILEGILDRLAGSPG